MAMRFPFYRQRPSTVQVANYIRRPKRIFCRTVEAHVQSGPEGVKNFLLLWSVQYQVNPSLLRATLRVPRKSWQEFISVRVFTI